MKATMGVKLGGETRQLLMKQAIDEYLDREEGHEQENQEDLQRWQQYKDTGDYVSHDEMKRKLLDLAAKARKRTKTKSAG